MVAEPREGFMKSGGYKIHYLLWGATGPKLVFIHSMGMDARGFDITCRALQPDYQILALDILDHGDSETPKEPVGLAAEHPEDFIGLVLVDIAPFERTGTRSSRPPVPEFFEDENKAREYLRQRYPDFTEEALENRVKYGLKKDEKGRLKRKPMGEAVRGGLDTDLWPYADRIRTPVLMTIGGTSTLVTPETLKRMKAAIPVLKAVTFEGVGHMVPQGKPEEFEARLRAFLQELDL
jgi:pimeloyl-ACP methyl ester carboxylesterase